MSRDFAAELAELKRVYIASLPGKFDEVAAAVARRSLVEARALAHKLRGTAGSYGVGAVSECVGAIEDRIDAAAGIETPDLWREIADLVVAARATIASLQ